MSAQQIPENKAAFSAHPARSRVLAEVHARPLMPIESPRRLLHFAFMTDHWAAGKDRAAFEDFCLSRGRPAPAPDAKHHRIEVPPAILRWEHHGEFTTYTWEFPSQVKANDFEGLSAFRPGPDELSNLMHLLPQPGPLLVAVDLHLLPERAVGESYRHLFGPEQLAASEVENGAARIATDFHPDAFGFVRILVLDRRLTASQAGALVQRLLEIETYRTLALLGLPQAQELAPTIRRIETELPLLLNEMRESQGFEANKHLLDRLTALAADLETGAAHSLFRFGATRAYHELIGHRLAAIDERALDGLPTFASFLSRRLTPAIRTCASTEARQDNLSRKLARAAQLLRTRVDIDLESQNSDLLRRMNNRARMQLRLQQTVEGLSIVALTYYLTAICHIAFEGIHQRLPRLDPTLATAMALPFAFIVVALMLRRIRKHYAEA
ncbi:DUF3422 family protein [Methylovirgula sp. HY1]|uniref:DUF3422 family protein n=1 Tax=Methylovirgula sp. HY1 TaxID=2822761 RepID=UPI001C5BFB5E|nr:DUF3422 domain-containing protein [Methylovirgula sp. HY1]QXX73224.1 hypothetical protein MHY1_00018 [Methylovirgula sp. HY1]